MPHGLSTRTFVRVAVRRFAIERWLRQLERRWPDHRVLVRDALAGGHRNRPVAALLACEAAGGRWQEARSIAVALECAHKASVIRDDLEDRDDFRRGRPTFVKRYGVELAVAVSDLLWSASLAQLVNPAPARCVDTTMRCLPLFVSAYHDMAIGQLADLHTGNLKGTDPADRLRVNALKTGSLGGLAFRVGAIAGGASAEQEETLARFGEKLGTAFQVLNDVNNLLGHEREHGRAAATDLRRRRHTVLLAHAVSVAPLGDRRRLEDLMRRDGLLSEQEVTEMATLLRSLGAHEYGERLALQLLSESRDLLHTLPLSPARDILYEVSTTRQFRRLVF